ncbi:MAG: SMC-Scp complex subunit ScpB [Planctomycetota bacterium]
MTDPKDADKDVGARPEPEGSAREAWIDRGVESLLIVADRAVEPARVAEAFDALGPAAGDTAVDAAAVLESVDRLNDCYEETNRAFRIERVAGGLRLMTTGDAAALVAAFRRTRDASKLSKPALETLSIIAYEQPITRARLEAIRGVACGEVLKTLLERKLITIKGRAEELGRPMLYGTTKAFLEVFGLAGLKDLPAVARPPAAGAFDPPARDSARTDAKAETNRDEMSDDEAGPATSAEDQPAPELVR